MCRKKEGWETGREEVKKEAGGGGRERKEERKEKGKCLYIHLHKMCVYVYKNTHISCIKYMYYVYI